MGFLVRWPLGVAVIAGGTMLAVAGCGPGVLLSSDTADQAVTTALEQAQSKPLVMSFSGNLSLEDAGLANLPGEIQSALGKLGSGTATGKLTQESGVRRELDVTAGGHHLSFVEYGNHGYVSRDGGGYAELPSSLPATPVVSSSDISTAVSDLGFTDAGPATKAGVSVEGYHAALTSAALEKLVEDLGGSAGGSVSEIQQAIALLGPLVTTAGSVDVWVSTANGSLVAASLSAKVSVDIGDIASAFAGLTSGGGGTASLPSGTASLSLGFDAQVSDYGGAIEVTQPVATATLPAGATQGWSSSASGSA